MSKCTCPSHDRTKVMPLPREKWKPGQRVTSVYHYEGEPIYVNTGTIIPRPSGYGDVLHNSEEGFWVQPDNLFNNGPMWNWDFMIEGGIGCYSPIMELVEW